MLVFMSLNLSEYISKLKNRLTPILNDCFGRRGTIFIAAIFSSVFCLAQGFAQDWQQMFAFRFLLGLGIGPKSATIPIYASECAPASVRGALVMMWQVFTAFGIMCGYLSAVAFANVQPGVFTLPLNGPVSIPGTNITINSSAGVVDPNHEISTLLSPSYVSFPHSLYCSKEL
jgi:MFS family permease